MSDRKGFDLGDYVEVKDRIKLFYELYGNGRLVTDHVEMLTAPDGKQRVMVTARAYRSPEDTLPGVGTSWMEIPGTTNYTRGSEVENAETSAWGRAIGSLGILIDRSIASANEVRDKGGEAPPAKPAKPEESPDPAVNHGEQEEMLGRVSRQGVIRKGTSEHFKLIAHQGPQGHAFGFRLEIDSDKGIPQCVVDGPLGEALYVWTGQKPETLIGKVAKVSGILYNVRLKDRSWYRLHVDRFENDDVILPAESEAAA